MTNLEVKSREISESEVQEIINETLKEIYAVHPELIKDETNLYKMFEALLEKTYVQEACKISKKIQTLDENGNRVEKQVIITHRPVGILAHIKGTNSSAFKSLLRMIDYSILPKKPLTHNPNEDKFIEAVSHIYWNTDAYKVGSTLTAVRRFCENIHYNVGTEGAKKTDTCLYHFSTTGGSGKTSISKKWAETVKKLGYDAGPVKVNERWIGSEFSKHIVSFQDEFFPPKGPSKEGIIEKLNPIICNDYYQVEYKGQDSFFLKSTTSLILNSNYLPFDTNTRRYFEISFNNVDFSKDKNKERIRTNEEDYEKWMIQALETVPFGKNWDDPIKTVKSSTNELVYMAQTVCETQVNFTLVDGTIREFVNAYIKATDSKVLPKALQNDVFQSIIEADIQPTHKVNGNLKYSKYDWEAIADMETSETSHTHDVLDGINDPIKATEISFKLYLSNPTDPDNGPKKEIEDDTRNEEPVEPTDSGVEPTDNEVVETKEEVAEPAQKAEEKPVRNYSVYEDEGNLMEELFQEIEAHTFKEAQKTEEVKYDDDLLWDELTAEVEAKFGKTPSIIEEVKEEVVEEELLKPTEETFTIEDAKKMKTPLCEDKFKAPNFSKEGEFVVTAEYEESYIHSVMEAKKAGKSVSLDRKGEHMKPVFFVYESDDLSKEEQLKKATSAVERFGENIFSVTDSGHKSFHILVLINPEDRSKVKQNFKFYWAKVANKIFGSIDNLDSACASVARLSRRPGGTRDDGSKQVCYYMNRNAKGIDLSDFEEDLLKIELTKELEELQRSAKRNNTFKETDELTKLKNFYNKNKSKWQLAYDTLVEGHSIPAGSNMIGTIKQLEMAGFDQLKDEFAQRAHYEHPSNIGKKFI